VNEELRDLPEKRGSKVHAQEYFKTLDGLERQIATEFSPTRHKGKILTAIHDLKLLAVDQKPECERHGNDERNELLAVEHYDGRLPEETLHIFSYIDPLSLPQPIGNDQLLSYSKNVALTNRSMRLKVGNHSSCNSRSSIFFTSCSDPVEHVSGHQ